MITAELISLMFFQCSPDLVNLWKIDLTRFWNLFTKYIPGIARNYHCHGTYCIGQYSQWGMWKVTWPPLKTLNRWCCFQKSVLFMHCLNIIQAQQCSLSARGHYVGPCLIAAHMFYEMHVLNCRLFMNCPPHIYIYSPQDWGCFSMMYESRSLQVFHLSPTL